MNFKNKIIELLKENNIDLFVDMDGVIALYDIGKPYNFDKKRPLLNNIKVIEEVSKMDNVNVYILSICRKDSEIKEKNDWLDKYAPFFKKENRNILSKETYPNTSSKDLKYNYLKEHLNNKTILVDDDNNILFYINENLKDRIILFQDSILVD